MHISERFARETGKEFALRVITDNIVHLDLKPGTMVSANELAVEMGLSRTPVREALNELSKTGIVEVFPQSGCRIALVDIAMIEESRFLRNTLECAVVREACTTIKGEELLQLKENLKLQEFYLDNHMTDKLLETDDEFHKMLFKITEKLEIYDLMKTFLIHYDRLRNITVIAVKDLKVVSDHVELVDAIEHNNPDLAAQIMDKHLSRYKFDVEQIEQECAEYFKPLD
ncbi:GntR family transcriptional regulator [Hespellia stercorisuis]|uniref:DNA-binding transcriptional regulator, GntR family n=1 Tax=Hespellia stercorisuis DSM 15480 TaxID=1121950 RepID=A0A1M6MSV4_9FIRM|nr:GntR family transcriptional regulator [Hespellia stercorisuis]SHJ86615.1 DNA-binding transcriptional regulator, GntR family [Hespellia stercorisuis DSM 15480]